MALTTAVFRKIEYSLIDIVLDGADPDELPDDVPVTGFVTITPIIPRADGSIGRELRFPGEADAPYASVADAVCTVENGRLYSKGSPYLWQLTTDNENVNPVNWRYRVTHFNMQQGGTPLTFPDFEYQLPYEDGSTVQLTRLIPLSLTPGGVVIQGPAGSGVATAIDNGDGTATVAAGTGGAGTGEVDTVNNQLPDVGGNVTLTQDNIPSGTTAKQFTAAYRDKVDVIDASANLVTVWGVRPEVWHTGIAWPADPRPIALPAGGSYNGPLKACSPSLPSVTSAPTWLRNEDIWEAAP